MDKIYLKGNYIVIEESGFTYVFPKYFTWYFENHDNLIINCQFNSLPNKSHVIEIANIGNYYDESGLVAYTYSTLTESLRNNSGFKSPPGGSGGGGVTDGDYGDITVSGGGTSWTIDNGVVSDANISDVDATKVTQNSTHRFITDAQLLNLANQSGVNTGDETTSSIQSKLGTASTSTDGYLTHTDWNTFNNKQDALGFVPVPDSRSLTINGVTYDLTADRSWTVSGSVPSGTTVLLYADETDANGSGTVQGVKGYTVPSNSYSLIMVEAEVSFYGGPNVENTLAYRLMNGTTINRELRLKQDATGSGDYWILGGSLKFSEPFTSGGLLDIDVVVINGAGFTWTVHSFRVYGIV